MTKEKLIEVMIERINNYKRHIAIQNENSLIELEKEILKTQPFLRDVMLGFYDLLDQNNMIKKDNSPVE
jgi:hypothetical protein